MPVGLRDDPPRHGVDAVAEVARQREEAGETLGVLHLALAVRVDPDLQRIDLDDIVAGLRRGPRSASTPGLE